MIGFCYPCFLAKLQKVIEEAEKAGKGKGLYKIYVIYLCGLLYLNIKVVSEIFYIQKVVAIPLPKMVRQSCAGLKFGHLKAHFVFILNLHSTHQCDIL